MNETKDLYEVLQVHPSAHPDVIQASYLQLFQLYDPVRNPYSNAGEMMDAINQAFQVLGDPARRALYDQHKGFRGKTPDVIQAKSFQLVDDEGNVRAELGCRTVNYRDSSDIQPLLELKDSTGQIRFSVSLDYFDQPRLVMGGEEDDVERFSVSLESTGDTRLMVRDEGRGDLLELSGGVLAIRDAGGATRLQAGLGGGDGGNNPRLVMRDEYGKTRLDIELVEVELDQEVAQVGDDYEVSPPTFALAPRLRLRDEEEDIRLEIGLFGTDAAGSPALCVLDEQENPRLVVGYFDDGPWVAMKDREGINRLEVELAEIETEAGHDYVPRLRVRDENEDIRFETGLPRN